MTIWGITDGNARLRGRDQGRRGPHAGPDPQDPRRRGDVRLPGHRDPLPRAVHRVEAPLPAPGSGTHQGPTGPEMGPLLAEPRERLPLCRQDAAKPPGVAERRSGHRERPGAGGHGEGDRPHGDLRAEHDPARPTASGGKADECSTRGLEDRGRGTACDAATAHPVPLRRELRQEPDGRRDRPLSRPSRGEGLFRRIVPLLRPPAGDPGPQRDRHRHLRSSIQGAGFHRRRVRRRRDHPLRRGGLPRLPREGAPAPLGTPRPGGASPARRKPA